MESPYHIIYPLSGIAEPMSALSHLLAALVFAVLGILLIKRTINDKPRVRSVVTYSCSVVALLLVSGIYHVLPREFTARDVFQRLDHAIIFVLIASTFTPIHTILFDGILRRGMLIWIWVLASIGIVLSLAFLSSVPEAVCLTFYLTLGWLGAITGSVLWVRYGFRFIRPLLFGSIAYTVGAVSDFVQAPILVTGVVGPHELFHLAVLAGIAFHWKFISSFANQSVARCPITRAFQLR